METTNQILHQPPQRRVTPLDATKAAALLIEQVSANTAAIEQLGRRFDEFAGAYLNARFPYGRPTDRWARRR